MMRMILNFEEKGELYIMGKRVEVKTGDVYGRLTVIKEVEPYVEPKSGRKARRVLAQCDCGSEPIEVRLSSLRSGLTTSCGCVRKEKLREATIERNKNNSKTNKYDLSGEYGIGYDCNGKEFYFDLEDFDLIKDYCWYIDNKGYVVAHDIKDSSKRLRMHRLVMNAKEGMDVDHINNVKSDNRKSNLREATRSQNLMNRRVLKNNTSGVTGVTWVKQINKWRAMIGVNRNVIHLGDYTTKEDAIKARKDAEQQYFGEYRCNIK